MLTECWLKPIWMEINTKTLYCAYPKDMILTSRMRSNSLNLHNFWLNMGINHWWQRRQKTILKMFLVYSNLHLLSYNKAGKPARHLLFVLKKRDIQHFPPLRRYRLTGAIDQLTLFVVSWRHCARLHPLTVWSSAAPFVGNAPSICADNLERHC